jgi:DNA adenine methylase
VFRHWKFTNDDLEKLDVRDNDFVYADPPYDVQFTTYSAAGFSWDDQVRTGEWLARRRGPVLLSNQATPRIVRLYRQLGFRLKFFNAPRRISSNGDRAPAREVLASRNL